MSEFAKTGRVEVAARRADMDRKTARKYLASGKLPGSGTPARTWRTRVDPFAEVWPEVTGMLEALPELEAWAAFEELQRRHPGRFQDGQLRTLQRHVPRWRALRGPEREIFFAQEHRPGEALQSDFTWATELGVTIGGVALPHMLCHTVLPYSNWESATVCWSEAMDSLQRGVQTALVRLGRAPRFHQTDNSTAATHQLGGSQGRGYNDQYLGFCAHYGMTARTTGVGKKEQNGDSEASHRVLKRRLTQRLLLRGRRDFATVVAYEDWLAAVMGEANRARSARLTTELAAMRPLPATLFPDYCDVTVRVTSGSTIRVKGNTYSVPSRLIGASVVARIHDLRLEIHFAGQVQLEVARLHGSGEHRINYRHLITSLVRKPGAFARYRFREDLFPTTAFRRAFDALTAQLSSRQAERHYLGILQLAAKTVEADVERALVTLLETGRTPTLEALVAMTPSTATPRPPELQPLTVDLRVYDGLFADAKAAV